MADTRRLLNGLRDYHATLTRHHQVLSAEYLSLERRYHALRHVYEGDAAEQFKAGWGRTDANFREYIGRGQVIMRLLEERIEALEAANQPSGELP
ncbi:hypothetical protein [Deinococcus hopiensis]|uniref:Uncharacterized protein n=1 Tax=Deinococcus hopiensis KR-140 TaxID=695939 RepID=A0A1W1ULJ7_9DEIO|nr:hypothetical protein [Deinococcus hopiensis]SMB82005.1 hypothetical protein SAMN00790413_04809 [Deinococcus hopiensis KR-140]